MTLLTALERFKSGGLDRPALLAAAAAASDSVRAEAYRRLLDDWREQQLLPNDLYESLCTIIGTRPVPDATRFLPAIPVHDPAGDRTHLIRPHTIESDIQSGEAESQERTRLLVHPGGLRARDRGRVEAGAHLSLDRLAQLPDDGHRPRVGTVLKRRFRLEKVLGHGGMSVVYRALDLRKIEGGEVSPYVAVKVLNDEFRRHPTALKALHREAQRAQKLAHPNVVRVHDFDREGSTAFLSMEYIRGETLKGVLARPGFNGMPLKDFQPVLSDMAAALACAHRAGLVHADFKPGNVFVTEYGQVKVFDFGIARAATLPDGASGDATLFAAAGLSALTPAYASLEMLEGEPPDPRDDVYALGCLSYELLSGCHPFGRKDARQARKEGLEPERIVGIGHRRWRALKGALALRRADRLKNVEALDSAIRGGSRRRRWVVTAAALLVCSAFAGLWTERYYLPGRRAAAVTAALASEDAGRIRSGLAALHQLPPRFYQDVLAAARQPLLDYHIEQARRVSVLDREKPDFAAGLAVLDNVAALYPDSMRITRARAAVSDRRTEYLKQLEERLKRGLAADRLVTTGRADSGVNVDTVLSQIAAVVPASPLLQDPRLLLAYQAHVRAALLDARPVLARRIIADAQRRFPGHPELRWLRTRAGVGSAGVAGAGQNDLPEGSGDGRG